MLQAILIGTLYAIARRIFESGIFDRIEELVRELMREDISGDAKRQKVHDALISEGKMASKIAIDTMIQIVLLKAKGL